VVLAYGNTKPNVETIPQRSLVRTIDIAPTVAARLGWPWPQAQGSALLDSLYAPYAGTFPRDSAYQETGIWFTTGALTTEGAPRVQYPAVTSLLNIDENFHYEFYVPSDLNRTIVNAKERAWVNKDYRLIVRTTLAGAHPSLYLRTDTLGTHDLLNDTKTTPEYEAIKTQMLDELHAYLKSQGVSIVPSGPNRFFYAENLFP
jgi:hypothetical protein